MPTPIGEGIAGRGEQADRGRRGSGRRRSGRDRGAARAAPRASIPASSIQLAYMVGDLAADRIGAAIGGLDDVAQLRLDVLGKDGADAPGGAVGRDRVVPEPAVVGVAPEIVARLDRKVARGEVDAPRRIARARPAAAARRRGRRGCARIGAAPASRSAETSAKRVLFMKKSSPSGGHAGAAPLA